MENQPNNSPILIVDDDEGLLFSIRAALLSAGLPDPTMVSDSRQVLDLVRKNNYHLALLDLIMPHLDGMEVLKQIKQRSPATECIILTAVDDVGTAVQAIRFGAYDYLVKPLQVKRTTLAVQHALERYQLKQGMALFERPQSFSDLKHPEAFKQMVAEDESMALVFHQAETCAHSDYNVMITGETGVGKGMLARILHDLSLRSKGPFVVVNMPTFSQNLFENDFFGHARGAYTGAVSDRKGFFETAQGGTLFLDEITELAYPIQGKLLQVIEEKEFYRLGSTEKVNVDLRIMSASNRDLEKIVRAGDFRGDLYFRLNEYHIHIPPLRRRPKDIMPLAYYFLRKHARLNNKDIQEISPSLADMLIKYDFPGNVRELEHIVASALLVEQTTALRLASIQNIGMQTQETAPFDRKTFPRLADVQRQHIEKALEITNGNRTHAAKLLGIGLRTLQRKLKTYDSNPE
ncbi:MAG: sigma-54 dependent transcriptional regulator [Desulfobacteraceae bacterium]|jgi:DNA-binding NtrC family response regulator